MGADNGVATASRIGWEVDTQDLPALFSVIDDNGIPVTITLAKEGVALFMSPSEVACEQCGRCLTLKGAWNTMDIDLERLQRACVVACASTCGRHLTLRLYCSDPREVVSVTGPSAGAERGGDVWFRLLQALASAREQGGNHDESAPWSGAD